MNTIECNQKCTKCSHWKYKDTASRLHPNKIIDCLLSISTAKELCIVGGEPLLFKEEIFAILEGLSKTKIRTVIITNGVSMDSNFIDKVSCYNIHIVVSIDTMEKEFWKFVRGANSYSKVFANLDYATAKLSLPKISVQSVLSKETEPHMVGVAEYARTKNIHHSVQNYVSEGFEGSWTPIEANESYQNTEILNSANAQQCFAADRNLSILQNGDVYTCFQQSWIENCEKPLGNLTSKTIEDILSSEYAILVSKKMKNCNLPCKVLKCNTKNETI